MDPPSADPAAPQPAALFIVTEKGFTYRLTLTAVPGGPAQILIRNADAMAASAADKEMAGDPRIASLVRLVGSVARREPLAGYDIIAAGPYGLPAHAGLTRSIDLHYFETWRGPRFAAHVVEAGGSAFDAAADAGDDAANDAADLARMVSPEGVAAAWLAAPGTGPSGGRLGVVVFERRSVARSHAGNTDVEAAP